MSSSSDRNSQSVDVPRFNSTGPVMVEPGANDLALAASVGNGKGMKKSSICRESDCLSALDVVVVGVVKAADFWYASLLVGDYRVAEDAKVSGGKPCGLSASIALAAAIADNAVTVALSAAAISVMSSAASTIIIIIEDPWACASAALMFTVAGFDVETATMTEKGVARDRSS